MCEYIGRLARMQETVRDALIIIPRLYTNKPRTTGAGYKGMMHQPDPEKGADLYEGIKAIRRLHIRALEAFGMPAADEMLYPENYTYLADVLAYHAIGARSVENQQHRLTASGIDAPVGMKNPTGGDFSVMLKRDQGGADGAHVYLQRLGSENEGQPLCPRRAARIGGSRRAVRPELPLRRLNRAGGRLLRRFAFKTRRSSWTRTTPIRCGGFLSSPRIAHEVMASRQYDTALKKIIKGLMIESYLEEGRQEIGDNVYGQSITDPCLGWGRHRAADL